MLIFTQIDQSICKAATQSFSHPCLSYICISHCVGLHEAHSHLKNFRGLDM